MTVIESILMGALQGITEFLPVSSSAHLVIAPWLFHMGEGNVNKLTYDVMLHFGSLFAILLIYGHLFFRTCRDDLANLRDRHFRDSFILKLIVGTIPAVVAGFLFKDIIETQLRTPYVTVFTLVAVSILMMVAERIHTQNRHFSFGLVLAIGIAQAIALVPGVSRSGITIAVAMLLGLRRTEAVDFSFLLSIPIILGVSVYESRHMSLADDAGMLYLVGMLSAFVFGALSLRFLIRYLKKHSLDVFAYYRIGLAILILLLSVSIY